MQHLFPLIQFLLIEILIFHYVIEIDIRWLDAVAQRKRGRKDVLEDKAASRPGPVDAAVMPGAKPG
jgi:hypothetical protein